MKFIKSNLAKKLIIVLVILMIFNIAIPQEVKAWDLAGILMKPLFALITTQLVVLDVTISALLNGVASLGISTINLIVSVITGDEDAGELTDAYLEKLFIGPDTIFSGQVRVLNANIFDVDLNTKVEQIDDKDSATKSDIVDILDDASTKTSNGYYLIVKLKQAISGVYVVIRNICAILMLAGLIYTGIRILMAVNIPTQRTTWLMTLQDWVIGLVLLIFSHILMYGIFYISDTIVDAIKDALFGFGGINFQLVKESLESFDSTEQIILILMLGYMIWLTCIFAISYMKRLMWVCILIVLAPIVSIMYAFGKDSKHIYSQWLREYVLTVFVQPFHLIVYYVLISIPLNISNSTGSYGGGLNFFDLIYALVAMSFIRPAEKYVRGLFGMNKGIANMASYDSGKQVVDKIKETVEKVVKVVAGTAAIVATGGAAAPAVAGAAGAAGAGAAGAEAGTLAAGNTATEAGKGLLDTTTSDALNVGSPQQFMLDSYDEGFGTNEWDAQERDAWARDIETDRLNQTGENDEERLARLQDQQNQYKEWAETEDDEDTKQIYLEQANILQPDIDNLEIRLNKGQESGTNNDNNRPEIDYSKEQLGINDNNNRPEIDYSKEQLGINDNNNRPEIDYSKEQLGINDNNNRPEINDNNSGKEQLGTSMQIGHADIGSADIGNADLKDQKAVDTDATKSLDTTKDTTGDPELDDYLQNLNNIDFNSILQQDGTKGLWLNAAEEAGQALHEGLHGIMDTMYVDGGAPEDWKKTQTRWRDTLDGDKKTRKENFVNDKNNIRFLVKENHLIEKYKKQYPDKSATRIIAMAEKDAKEQLTGMGDYVDRGITNIQLINSLSQDQTKYGYSVDEAISQRGKFEKFNNDIKNIQNINETYNEEFTSVEEAIPNAKDYFNNGYRNVNDMKHVDFLQAKFDIKSEFAMMLDKAISKNKGGKIEYKGNNPKEKKVIDEINNEFSSKKEGV